MTFTPPALAAVTKPFDGRLILAKVTDSKAGREVAASRSSGAGRQEQFEGTLAGKLDQQKEEEALGDSNLGVAEQPAGVESAPDAQAEQANLAETAQMARNEAETKRAIDADAEVQQPNAAALPSQADEARAIAESHLVAVKPLTISMLNALLAQGERGRQAAGLAETTKSVGEEQRGFVDDRRAGDGGRRDGNESLPSGGVTTASAGSEDSDSSGRAAAGAADVGSERSRLFERSSSRSSQQESADLAEPLHASGAPAQASRLSGEAATLTRGDGARPASESAAAGRISRETVGMLKIESASSLAAGGHSGPGGFRDYRFEGLARGTRSESAAPGNRAAFEAQVARGLAAAISQANESGGRGSITLRLQPEALGPLQIRIELGDVAVGVRFLAGSPAARDLLESSMAGLRSSLESKGLAVEKLSVEVRPAEPEARTPEPASQSAAHGSRQAEGGDGPEAQWGSATDGGWSGARDGSPREDPERSSGRQAGPRPEVEGLATIDGPDGLRIEVLDLITLRLDATA